MHLQLELLLFTFVLSGVTLKISDFLGERGNTSISYLFAAISAFLFGILMSESVFSSSLLLGITLGVIVSKKVDRPNMIFGLVLTLIFAFFFKLQIPDPGLMIVVTLLTYVDELGHDKISQNKGFQGFFFRYRFTLKLAMMILTAISTLQKNQLIAFLCFDVSYDLTNLLISNVLMS